MRKSNAMLTGLALLLASSSCTRDPAVLRQASPNVPAAVYKSVDGTRTAVVAVTLDAAGKVTAASIFQGTGNAVLDAAAVDAAKRTTYSPGETNCAPSGGTFGVQFTFANPTMQTDAQGQQCPSAAHVLHLVAPDGNVMRETGIGFAVVAVEVTIGPDGKVTKAAIARSSGNSMLDQAAMTAAVQSTYAPKLDAVPIRRQAGASQQNAGEGVRCVPGTGSYIFRVTFRTP